MPEKKAMHKCHRCSKTRFAEDEMSEFVIHIIPAKVAEEQVNPYKGDHEAVSSKYRASLRGRFCPRCVDVVKAFVEGRA